MPYVYPINFFASSISKELQKVASQSAMLGQEAATNKRSISSIPSANIIISAIEHNQLTSISCAIASIVSAVEYLQIAKSGLQEQQTLLHSTLNLVTQVITDPSLQTLSNLAIVNNQLQTQIQQVQKIVDTTQDVNGIEILSNTSFSFTPGAAVPLQYLINNTGNTIGQASFANATPAVVNAAIIANLAGLGITDASARTLVAQNLTNAANIATAHTGTVAEYLYYAIYMIPTIAIPPSQVQQYFNDAIRAEQLIALLPQVLVDSGLYSGVPLTGLNPPSTVQNYGSNVVAAMTNTSIPNNHLNESASGWGFYDAGTPPNTPASIAFANLLTVAEKNALIADSSSTFINAIYGRDYTLNHYQGASPIAKFLVYITSFINIDPNGTTILDLSNIEGGHL